ncbi:TBC1 domain family member 13 [Aphelenchoides besseyi]|nr:TBC1 domain family member 13 [Aphelenchoides besseyi]
MSSKYIERITHIENLLLIQNLVIDTSALRDACIFGIPEQLRPLCWRLFLNYLPTSRTEWPTVLEKRRRDYFELVENLTADDFKVSNHDLTDSKSEEAGDHPLSDESQSEWNRYFKDNEILVQIDKDVRRMRPEIDFFQRQTNYPLRNYSRLSKRINSEDLSAETTEKASSSTKFNSSNLFDSHERPNSEASSIDDREFHWQVVERILYVYAKMNPGIKYVQGMNEIIGPIYYVLGSDPDHEWAKFAEPDAFYCFQNLCSEVRLSEEKRCNTSTFKIKDNFMKELDSSNCGIESTLTTFYQRFALTDPQLYDHMAKLSIKPQFYAFRWLSLLLSQEFSLPDTIFLWDTILASYNRIEMTEFICLAMLVNIRDELFAGDFAEDVRLLQHYPVVDVSNLVSKAWELKMSELEKSSRGGSGKASGSQFWKGERFSAFVNGAKERFTNYANNARRNWNKSDGNIVYRP